MWGKIFKAVVVIVAPLLIKKGYELISENLSGDNSKADAQKESQSVVLGSFIVWGRPDTGKTTFINKLRQNEPAGKGAKQATTSRQSYKDLKIKSSDKRKCDISEVVDMPGTKDRLNDWLKDVVDFDHIFYMVNLEKLEDITYH